VLARIAKRSAAMPRRILLIAGLLVIAAAVVGAPVAGHLSAGGFASPNAPSTKANNLLASKFHAGDPNLVLQVNAPVDSARARAEGTRLVHALGKEHYAGQISSYWTAPASLAQGLRTKDGHSGLVVARIAGDDDSAPKRAGKIVDRILADPTKGVTVKAGGIAMAYHQVTTVVSHDLELAEAVAVPLTMIVLIWVFGSVVAALLPLAVGIVSIVGTLAILRGLAALTHVSVYAMNLTTALGLALAIDYSLFIVSRYREEMHRPNAIRITLQTAGRTVLFSAMTVALSLAAMLVFPVYFLRSFAYAGIAVVALAAIAALFILPALLAVLGPRVNSLDLRVPVRRWLHRPPPAVLPPERTFWGRVATAVMRRALPIGIVVTAFLLFLGSPFLGIKFGYPDDRVLPTSATSRQVGDALRADYPSNTAATISIVAPDISKSPNSINAYAARLSTIDNVASVSANSGVYAGGRRIVPLSGPAMTSGNTTYVVVRSTPDSLSNAGKRVLNDVKATNTPWSVLITGAAAENSDSLHALGAKLPLAIGLIALTTFCVLFLFTGSIVLPVKALVLNTLSLSVAFGAMVWIFQDGHLIGLYGSTVTGVLVPTMPILMFCLSFGMSMDYEVFLLSRIREEWLRTGDNRRAVGIGLGRTGRLITAAALLMAIVFASLATGRVSFMQLFGTGLTLAVLADATLVRGVLVPAFMKLAGRANWWAPKPLARWHERHGWAESEPDREPDETKHQVVVKTG
jgi:RND superfamily putative drug exporter